jgi:hypothetical protein
VALLCCVSFALGGALYAVAAPTGASPAVRDLRQRVFVLENKMNDVLPRLVQLHCAIVELRFETGHGGLGRGCK